LRDEQLRSLRGNRRGIPDHGRMAVRVRLLQPRADAANIQKRRRASLGLPDGRNQLSGRTTRAEELWGENMMQTFFAWLEVLTWAPALCFLFALAIGACIVILLIDAGARKFAARQERRAIRARNWQLRQQRVQLILDAQREREQREAAQARVVAKRLAVNVWRDRVQQNRESKQFHVAAAFRDVKGTHR
jgi:hypothetical protein